MSLLKEQITVMQAEDAGKTIEKQKVGTATWSLKEKGEWYNFAGYNYRIKKEKKMLYAWLSPYGYLNYQEDGVNEPANIGVRGQWTRLTKLDIEVEEIQ